MINQISISGLFGKQKIFFPIHENLALLTGDNGSGKTTVLNIIYNVLSSEFINLFKFKFESIKIEFEENTKELHFVEVVRKKSIIDIKYQFSNKEYVLKAEKFNELERYSVTYLTEDDSNDEYDSYEYDSFFNRNFNVLEYLDNYPELIFINEIKNSILYFPTFRRIGSDLENLRESALWNYDHKIKNELDESRLVIGMDNNEIEYLFDSYSNLIRRFNSEGLDELLKKFVKNFISNMYKENQDSRNKLDIKEFDNAANNLLELIEKLGISDDLSKDEIKKYFKKQREQILVIDEGLKDIEKIKKGQVINSKDSLQLNEMTKGLELMLEVIQIVDSNKILFQLISLYGDHIKEQEKILEPIRYLKKGFEIFFKDKIVINFDDKNYNLGLSVNFDVLSTGEKQMITLLSFIGLFTNNETFRPLVIIDEPELSLHISWQKKLLKYLLGNGDHKFIITTHSPYIANINYRDYVKQLGEIDEYS